MKLKFLKIKLKFSIRIKVLPTFELVRSEMKLMYQKACIMRKLK